MANAKTAGETVKKVDEAKDAVKEAVKAVETKAEQVKTEAVKAETAVAAAVKAEAEKLVSAEQADVPEKEIKPERKKPGRKPGSKSKTTKPEKKVLTQPEIFIQFGPGESSVDNVVERIRKEYVQQGHRVSSIKSLKVYLKPEDRSAYYVINDKVAGRVDLF